MNGSEIKSNSPIKWKNYTVYIGLAILLLASSLLSDTFLGPMNIMNVAKQIAMPCVLAIGMTFVIITGGIDLSPGRVVSLTGVFLAMLTPVVGIVPAIIIDLAFGALLGMVYGLCITKLSFPPFITTLVGYTVCRGTALVITSSAPIAIKSSVIAQIGSGKIGTTVCLILYSCIAVYLIYKTISGLLLKKPSSAIITIRYSLCLALLIWVGWITHRNNGLSLLVLIAIMILLIFMYILNSTVFGRNVYAVGGNINAARLAGVNTHRTIILVYMLCSVLAAVGGIMTAGRLGTGSPLIGDGYELDAIAAVVIGGTSMMGGSGKLSRTVIGVLLIGVLNNMLSLLGVTSDTQMIIKGFVIFLAVVIDSASFRKKI